MSRLLLSIATTDYDHFRDFRLGLVTAEGIDRTWLTLATTNASRGSPRTASSTSRSSRLRNS
jgi:hypothetical protein